MLEGWILMNTEHDSPKLNIIDDNWFSYDYYKKLVDKYMEMDSREINFQNRIVIPFLEELFTSTDIMIVDVSTQYDNRNSKIHNNSQYKGSNAAPPDLLIARNWKLDNLNNTVDYLAAIEIKSPKLDSIYNKEMGNYNPRTIKELKSHLSKNSRVILTDCIRWQFFERGCASDPIPPIDLFDENKKWKTKIVKTMGF